MKILRDSRSFYIHGERFYSYQEVQCFRYLRFLGFSPGDMNHEYPVGSASIDFYPGARLFWEHHPVWTRSGEDLFQYGKRRRLLLNSHGYRDTPLVISDVMFKDQWEICDYMNSHGVDFRGGAVEGSPSICFVRGFEPDWDREAGPLLELPLPQIY